MDGQRFDGIARAFAGGVLPRRRVLATLAGAAVAGAGARRAAAQDAGTPTIPAGDACAAGFTACPGDGCVDLRADILNCGACGAVCESGLVPVRCREGICERANCAVGQDYCGAVDGCRDLQTDPVHCGGCGASCGDDACRDGACATPSCTDGQTACGGACVDLCCNNDHCGACGNACTGGLTCFEAVCDCPSGLCGEPPAELPGTGSGNGAGPNATTVSAALAGAALLAGWLGLRRHDARGQR